MADLDQLLQRLERHGRESAAPITIASAGARAIAREVRELRDEVAAHRRLASARAADVLELAARARRELGATENTAVDPMSAYATLATLIEAVTALGHLAAHSPCPEDNEPRPRSTPPNSPRSPSRTPATPS